MKSLGRILLFMLPVVVLLTGIYMISEAKKRVTAAQDEETILAMELKNLEDTLEALYLEPDIDKVPAEVHSQEEQARFIEYLKELARETGSNIEQFTMMPAPPPPVGTPLENYHALPTRVVLLGSYTGLRAFAYRIMQSDRLLNMMGVRWERIMEGPACRLSMTITRYGMDAPIPSLEEDFPDEEGADPETEENLDDTSDETIEDAENEDA
jgi:Tfp pilus assembly protein PilO